MTCGHVLCIWCLRAAFISRIGAMPLVLRRFRSNSSRGDSAHFHTARRSPASLGSRYPRSRVTLCSLAALLFVYDDIPSSPRLLSPSRRMLHYLITVVHDIQHYCPKRTSICGNQRNRPSLPVLRRMATTYRSPYSTSTPGSAPSPRPTTSSTFATLVCTREKNRQPTARRTRPCHAPSYRRSSSTRRTVCGLIR